MSVSPETQKGYLFFALLITLGVAAVVLLRGFEEDRFDLLDAVPMDADMVVYVPNISELGGRLQPAVDRLGLGRHSRSILRRVNSRLGFNPFREAQLERRGLRPKEGVVLYAPPGERLAVAILGIGDIPTFEKSLLQLLGAGSGARLGEKRHENGVRVHVAEERGRPVAAWTYRGDVVFVSTGPGAVERVGAGAGCSRGGVRANRWFSQGEEAVWQGSQLRLWASSDSIEALPHNLRTATEAYSVGISVAPTHLSARVWVGLSGSARSIVDVLRKEMGEDGSSFDVSRNILTGRAHIDLVRAWSLAELVGLPAALLDVSQHLSKQGLSMKRDVLPLFDGAFEINAGLSEAGSLDPNKMHMGLTPSFLDFLDLIVSASVTDEERAQTTLPKIASTVTSVAGDNLEVVRIDDLKAYRLRLHPNFVATVGLREGTLVLANREGSYVNAMEGLSSRKKEPEETEGLVPADGSIGGQGALKASLSVPNLISAIHHLPRASIGDGATARMLRSASTLFHHSTDNLNRVNASLKAHRFGAILEIHADIGSEDIFGLPPGE